MGYVTKSKYLNNREDKIFRRMSIIFILVTVIMPPYFGIPVPGFDLTMIRIMMIVITVMIVTNKDRLYEFVNMLRNSWAFWFIVPYLFVVFYTMVLRIDTKAFLNPFIEIFIFLLTIYVIRSSLGVKTTIMLLLGCYYVLVFQGVIEYARGESLFKLMKTLSGNLVGGNFVRSGQYRIMGPAPHSIAYGLMLAMGVPLAALDFKKERLYLFQRPILLFMLFTNIVLTGSRGSLAVFFLELLLIFVLSTKIDKKRTLVVGAVALVMFGGLLTAISGTNIGRYFLLQISNVIDELFGTNFASNFGATAVTNQSSAYRDALWYVFKVKYINPIVGAGRSGKIVYRIKTNKGIVLNSIDNYYIAEYLRYAYPGMYSYIFFMASYIVMMIIKVIKDRDFYSKALLIASVGYAWGLYYVDSLGTLKFLYLFYAMFVVNAMDMFAIKDKRRKSIYLRQKVYERA